MQIISSAFPDNQKIPPQYTCDGENINPPLEFLEIPGGAKSLALIVDDPDAPRGDWVHWLIWNIPPQIKKITAGGVPSNAVEGATDFGKPGYGGPCPPSGTHRYQFKLYALDMALEMPKTAVKKDLESAMAGHVLEEAKLTGLYQRQ